MFEMYFFDKMLDFSDKVDMFLNDETFLDDYLYYADKKNMGTDDVSNFPGYKNSILDSNVKNKPQISSNKSPKTKSKYEVLNTKEIYDRVSKKVIGQDDVVKAVLSVIIRNRMVTVPDLKSNIFLIGGTGTGKTLVTSIICQELGIPYTIEDASKYTQEGYVGDSVSSMIRNLIDASGGDIKKAEHGVIYIDEIDKKTDNGDRSGVSTTSVQDSLLKMIEGTKMNVGNATISTEFITFIVGGACESVYEAREKRLKNKGNIGFITEKIDNTNYELKNPNFIPDDLINGGFKKEFVGRHSLIKEMHPMTISKLEDIINKSQISVFNLHLDFLKSIGVEIKMNRREVVKEIANRSIQRGTGARGVKSIVEEMFEKLYEDITIDKKNNERYVCTISKNTVRDNTDYQIKKYELISN